MKHTQNTKKTEEKNREDLDLARWIQKSWCGECPILHMMWWMSVCWTPYNWPDEMWRRKTIHMERNVKAIKLIVSFGKSWVAFWSVRRKWKQRRNVVKTLRRNPSPAVGWHHRPPYHSVGSHILTLLLFLAMSSLISLAATGALYVLMRRYGHLNFFLNPYAMVSQQSQ